MPRVSKKPKSGRRAGGVVKRHRRKSCMPRPSSPQLVSGEAAAAFLACGESFGPLAVGGSPKATALAASHSQSPGLAPDTPTPAPTPLGKRKRSEVNYKEMNEGGHPEEGAFKKRKTKSPQSNTGCLAPSTPPKKRRKQPVLQLDTLAPGLLEMAELMSSRTESNSSPQAVSVSGAIDKHYDSDAHTGAAGSPIVLFQDMADIEGARSIMMMSQSSTNSTTEEIDVRSIAGVCDTAPCPSPNMDACNTTAPKMLAKKASKKSRGRPKKGSA